MKTVETEITTVRYNFTALLGWLGLCIGLVGGVAQYVYPSVTGFVFLVIGLVGGGITITFSGPLKTTIKRKIHLHPVDTSIKTRK